MKKLVIMMVVLVGLLALSIGAPVYAQQDVTLSLVTHDQLYIDYFNSRLPEWEALHPDIHFTYDFQHNTDRTQVYQAMAAGEQIPDLVGIEQGDFPNYMKNGAVAEHFVDLTDSIADVRDQYAEGRWSIYSYEGRVYAIESSLTAGVYYYQPAIFEANDVEVPATWEEALDVGAKLAAAGSAFTFATNNGNYFEMMFNERGGNVFDENANYVFNDETNRPLAIEVADLIQRGVQNGTFFVVLGDEVWNGVTIPTAYHEGRLAGTVMPDWWSTCCLQPNVPDMAGQWAIAAPPRWAGGGAGTLSWGGTGFAVNKQSPNAEIAQEFIEFMYLGKESQVQRFEQINMFPTMFEAANDPRVSGLEDEFYGGQKIGEVYAALAPDVPVWYQSPFRSNWLTAVSDNLPALFDGSMTPEAFVDEVHRVTQEAIDFGF